MSATTETKPCMKHSRAGLGIGFALGLLVGVGMLVGAWLTMSVQPSSMQQTSLQRLQSLLPERALHAVATDSGDTFAIATGPISEEVEGIFTLDFLTGDLQCWVFNSRTNQIGGYFSYNVVRDLGMDQSRKNPHFLMVTGRTGLRGGGSSMAYAECVLYVADANSGNIAGYAVPWNRTLASRTAQKGTLMPVFKQAARHLEIRGQ